MRKINRSTHRTCRDCGLKGTRKDFDFTNWIKGGICRVCAKVREYKNKEKREGPH